MVWIVSYVGCYIFLCNLWCRNTRFICIVATQIWRIYFSIVIWCLPISWRNDMTSYIINCNGSLPSCSLNILFRCCRCRRITLAIRNDIVNCWSYLLLVVNHVLCYFRSILIWIIRVELSTWFRLIWLIWIKCCGAVL